MLISISINIFMLILTSIKLINKINGLISCLVSTLGYGFKHNKGMGQKSIEVSIGHHSVSNTNSLLEKILFLEKKSFVPGENLHI